MIQAVTVAEVALSASQGVPLRDPADNAAPLLLLYMHMYLH